MTEINSIWNKLNKEMGGDLLFRADEPMRFNWDVIEYPCVSLGSAVGVWGVPLGKITQFHGAENSGKTFLAMLMAKAALEKYPGSEVVWVDAELSFDKKWAAKIGLDPGRVRVISSNSGVDIFTVLCGKNNDKGKKVMPGILDLIHSGDLNVKLVVLDSIAQLIPPAETNRGFDDMEMAALARFLPKALRLLRPALSKAKCAMICINQLRDSMAYGAQPTYSGGRAYRFNLDFAIKLHPSTKKENILLDSKGEKVGHMILATVEKSRGGVNRHTAAFYLNFNEGVVKLGEELAILAKAYGVVQCPTKMSWVYGDHRANGKDNFFELLDNNPGLRAEIFAKVKEAKASGIEVVLDLGEEAAALAATTPTFGDDGEEPPVED